MLPTKFIKKGCIISFISLLLLAAVLYFVVYKTLVLESFADETRKWGKDVMTTGGHPDIAGDPDNAGVFEATVKFGRDDSGGVCGGGTRSQYQADSCSNIVDQLECNNSLRVKKKYKGQGDYSDFDSLTELKAEDGQALLGEPGALADETKPGSDGYDENGVKSGVDYKINYNIYPCKWEASMIGGGGPEPGAAGECTNDYENRCVSDGFDGTRGGMTYPAIEDAILKIGSDATTPFSEL